MNFSSKPKRARRGATALKLVLAVSIASFHTLPASAEETKMPGISPTWQHYPSRPVAPAGAPNILLVMTDDVGFGSSSTFGGLIPTPNLDELADNGLRYTRFHTTAMCSPTRAALLTGRNHHAVNSGSIGNMSIDREGYTSVIPKSAATIGQILGMNGYHTAWIGKNHNTPLWEDTPLGPFDRWPNGLGFDYFYGFNASQTDQFAPALIENRNRISVPDTPNYIFEADMADHAIDWLRKQGSIGGGAPFLLYYAPGAAHAPLQAPPAWIERFRGKFDMGWDEMRAEICSRQKASGTIPRETTCTPRPKQIPAWASLSKNNQRFAARLMEAYAAMLAYSDDQFGRIIAELKESGRYDNTLVIFIQGDNGASSESLGGEFNEIAFFNQVNTEAGNIARLDKIGGPDSRPVSAAGWAWAMNAPFQWSKQIASHFGGSRNGLVVSWPDGIAARGDVRTQFHHVIDIAPTLYEIAGVTPPAVFEGADQQRIDGTSMRYSFNSSAAAEPSRPIYFEMLGNRALYKDGWVAATTPKRMPWAVNQIADEYDWELYDVSRDFSQSKDMAKTRPDKLAELKSEFETVAAANNVLPIDDRFLARFESGLRPAAFDGANEFIFYPTATTLSSTSFPTLASDWIVTADLNLQGAAPTATVITRGDKFGGWALYIDAGRARLMYRRSHLPEHLIELRSPILGEGRRKVSVKVERLADRSYRLSLLVEGIVVDSRDMDALAFARTETTIGKQGDNPLYDLAKDSIRGVEIEKLRVSMAR